MAWFTNCTPGDPLCERSIARNREELLFWESIQPDLEIESESWFTAMAARIGCTPGIVDRGCMIVHFLGKMPRLRELALELGHLDFQRLSAVVRGVIGVQDDLVLRKVEDDLLVYFTPKHENQNLPTFKKITERIRKLLCKLDRAAAEKKSKPKERELHISSIPGGASHVGMYLPGDEAREIAEIVRSAAKQQKTNEGDALLALLRGKTEAKIVLHAYGPTPEEPEYVAGGGWLDWAQSQDIRDRVSEVREMGIEPTEEYRPSESLAKFVEGRDGTCRFPGCSHPAIDCDIDHVVNWQDGGPTAAHNLQCLCRRHHNMKTDKRIRCHMTPEGIVTWVLPDGQEIVTEPEGPVAQNGRWGRSIRKRIEKARKYRRQAA